MSKHADSRQLIFVFNNPSSDLSNWIGPLPSYHALSDFMSRSWLSFVYDLDPNRHGIDGLPYWPAYDASNPMNMVFMAEDNHEGSYVERDDYRSEQLLWWNEHWDMLRS